MARGAVLGRLTWQLADVVAVTAETPRVRSLTLRVPGWEGHRAGQHIDVRLTAEDGYQAQRSYSIASAPEDPLVVITVERLDDGEMSPYLVDELRVGDQVELRGPIGGYFTWSVPDGGPLVLVAGGSGIVPLMAMLRHRRAAKALVPAYLLYSARSPDEIIYRGELNRLASGDSTLRVAYTLTRTQPEGWTGYRRRVDRQMLEEVLPGAALHPLAFLCGPTRMVEDVATQLTDLGYEPTRVKTERFGPTGGS